MSAYDERPGGSAEAEVNYDDEPYRPSVLRQKPAMPPEIAKAIVAVMAKITPLTKDSENKFQRYSYVSVDQFYDLVGRLMADAGLFVVAFESRMTVDKRATSDDRGMVKESVWLSAVYDLMLYHESGAEFGPIERSITVPASGAQAYASAMSYVEKYFLRSLFKIPTGDVDADADDKQDLPIRDVSRNRVVATGPTAQKAKTTITSGHESKEDMKRHYLATAKREWSKLTSQAAMRNWWDDSKVRMSMIFDGKEDPVYLELKTAYSMHGASLPAPIDEEIPY